MEEEEEEEEEGRKKKRRRRRRRWKRKRRGRRRSRRRSRRSQVLQILEKARQASPCRQKLRNHVQYCYTRGSPTLSLGVTTPRYLHQLTDDLANKKETAGRQTVQMPELGD